MKGLGLIDANDLDDDLPDRLQHVKTDYIPNTECSDLWPPQYNSIEDYHICAGGPDESAQFFDKGGPLYDKVNGVLVGVLSRAGFYTDYPSGYTGPSVATGVGYEWEWIKETICLNHSAENRPSFCDITRAPTPSPSSNPSYSPCEEGELTVTFDLRTDSFPEETSWNIALYDPSSGTGGAIVAGETSYNVEDKLYEYQFCLSVTECYMFRIFDEDDDGTDFEPDWAGYNFTVDGMLLGTSYDDYLGDFGSVESSGPFGSCNEPEFMIRSILKPPEVPFRLCVQAKKTSNGSGLRLKKCNKNDQKQVFKFNTNDQIVLVSNNLCLTKKGPKGLKMLPCSSGTNKKQRWVYEEDDSNVRIKGPPSKKHLSTNNLVDPDDKVALKIFDEDTSLTNGAQDFELKLVFVRRLIVCVVKKVESVLSVLDKRFYILYLER